MFEILYIKVFLDFSNLFKKKYIYIELVFSYQILHIAYCITNFDTSNKKICQSDEESSPHLIYHCSAQIFNFVTKMSSSGWEKHF